jgi:DNA polymerase III delta prime subunit
MLLQKYKPRVLEEVLGNSQEIRRLRSWMDAGSYSTPVLLTGPTGTGKTTIAHFLAYQSGYQVQEFNAATEPSVHINLTSRRIFPTLIIIDDADLISDITPIMTAIKSNKSIPIVLIASEIPYKLKTLAGYCLHIALHHPPTNIIENYIRNVVKKERLPISDQTLTSLLACADIRYILNNIQTYTSSKDATYTMYSAFNALMAKNGSRASMERVAETDAHMLPLMLYETYPIAVSPDDICRTADYLAAGTIIDEYVHHTHDWELASYSVSNNVGVAYKYKRKTPPSFPTWLGKNSTAQRKSRELREVSGVRSPRTYRLDYMGPLDVIIGNSPAPAETLRAIDVTRDAYIDVIRDLVLDPVPFSSAQKSALTRSYKAGPDKIERRRRPKKAQMNTQPRENES